MLNYSNCSEEFLNSKPNFRTAGQRFSMNQVIDLNDCNINEYFTTKLTNGQTITFPAITQGEGDKERNILALSYFTQSHESLKEERSKLMQKVRAASTNKELFDIINEAGQIKVIQVEKEELYGQTRFCYLFDYAK